MSIMPSRLEKDHDARVVDFVADHAGMQRFLRSEFENGTLGLRDVPPVVLDQRVQAWIPESIEK